MKKYLMLLAVVCLLPMPAADHREAPAVNGAGEGDLGDVFAFLDPNDPSRLVFIMGVNPFAVPGVQGSYKFSPDFLYQFKVDKTGDYVEDLVVQVVFEGLPPNQTYRVWVVNPDASMTGTVNRRATGEPYLQAATSAGAVTTGDLWSFAGLRDDPFVFDAGQLNRILGGTQDVFRGFTTPVGAVGALRGRPVRADGTSGNDTFGGFNGSFLAVAIPKIWVNDTGVVSVWGTVSAPLGGGAYYQFERMGQAAFSTVFVPGPLRDAVNSSAPADDVARLSGFIPDALTTNDTDGRNNTIAGRRTVLTVLGLTALPNGVPLTLPAGFANTNRNLLRAALLPDVIRLDLGHAPNDLAIGAFGLQNGRRPGDDSIDILMRLARELADVNFPDALGVPGSGPARPGALNFSDRRVLVVLQGTDFIKPDGSVGDVSTQGNERPLPNTFPFLAPAHPLPGGDDTTGFPPI
jgi:hypothetical protein